MPRWNSCNILQTAPDANRLWQFDAKGGGFVLNRESAARPASRCRPKSVAKSWISLWQPKLNVAWLPPENVFLRIIELPKALSTKRWRWWNSNWKNFRRFPSRKSSGRCTFCRKPRRKICRPSSSSSSNAAVGGRISRQARRRGLSRRPARSPDARPVGSRARDRRRRMDLSGVTRRPERRTRRVAVRRRTAEFELFDSAANGRPRGEV